jgi:FHS family L-fucose permease-like MFS transporter
LNPLFILSILFQPPLPTRFSIVSCLSEALSIDRHFIALLNNSSGALSISETLCKVNMFGKKTTPAVDEVHSQHGSRRPSIAVDTKRKVVDDHVVTGAGEITLRQSILPVSLVTILFFMWGFAYGLLDVLNSNFQETLGISQGKSGGLQAAYFGAYFIGPLTYSGWIVRRFGYRWTFITGLCIYGVGALMFWPAAVKRS